MSSDQIKADVKAGVMKGKREPQVVTVTFAEYFPRSMYVSQLKKVIEDIEGGGLIGQEMDENED